MTGGKGSGADDLGIAEALAEWPSRVRAPGDWDAAAKKVLAALRGESQAGSALGLGTDEAEGLDAGWDDVVVDESVLEPPLPQGADEPHEFQPPEPVERRSGSVAPPMAGRSDADLHLQDAGEERESAPPASMLRPSTRPPPALAAPAPEVPPPAPMPPASLFPPPHTAALALTVPPPPMAPLAEPPKRRWGAAVLLAGAVCAAACTWLAVKTRTPAAAPVAASVVSSAPVAVAVDPQPAASATPEEANLGGAALAMNAVEQDKAPPPPKPKPARGKKKGGAAPAKQDAVTGSDNPQSVMRIAASPTGEAAGIAQRPTSGALQSALASTLPRARACLRPSDAASRATILFDASGKVRTVRVAGPASGKPAEACIQGALGQTRLAPFAEPTFSATVTVRP